MVDLVADRCLLFGPEMCFSSGVKTSVEMKFGHNSP